MPLLRTMEFEGAILMVWLLTESWQELSEMVSLSEPDRLALEKITNDSRKREFLAVRLLVRIATGKSVEIAYRENGSPFLREDSRYLSITHSRNAAAILLSPTRCGIDAETKSRRISTIAPRFLSDPELEWTSQAADREMACLFCWCCKEAAFKMMGIRGVDFRTSILVRPTVLKAHAQSHVWFHSGGDSAEFPVKGLFLNGNMIVWCVQK